jgi:holliday junction DNA helicase RuvA
MIVQITGKVVSIGETSVTVQVGDLGYEIFVPSSVVGFYKKKSKNGSKKEDDAETFHTIQYIEGSSGHGNQFVRLVGFRRKIEKDFFQLYTSVEGIGYKTALKSLILPIQKISLAIENNDLATLKKLPHIGGRTSDKMVATLKGRMKKFILDHEDQPLTTPSEPDLQSEVVQVLQQVGYNESESLDLMQKALGVNPKIKTAEEMIQEIFRLQGKS